LHRLIAPGLRVLPGINFTFDVGSAGYDQIVFASSRFNSR
jgi:hypothetical protein